MRIILISITILLSSAFYAADNKDEMEKEIMHLLGYLKNSDCEFNRNGKWYSAKEVSVVFNEPIEELLDWAIFAVDGSTGYRRVCWWLEPAGYALDVWPCGPEQVQASVLTSYWQVAIFCTSMQAFSCKIESILPFGHKVIL